MKYRFLRFPEGKTKAVTFSYDDGVRFDIPLAQIFDNYNMKCTFNISSHPMTSGSSFYLTADQIKEHLLDKGHEIAVHGARHRAPGQQTALDGIQDVLYCRKELEEQFGMIIRGMAYPDTGIVRFSNGASYDNIKRYLTDLGIVYARSLSHDNDEFMLPTDWHNWIPSAKHTNPLIFDYIKKFTDLDVDRQYIAGRYPRLFYIWGHSFEFDRENNWDRIEQICQQLSHKEDTWYATNMDIYRYVSAYNSLEISVDGSMIHNPTLVTIWFLVDDKTYCIHPGETLTIQ